MVLKDLKKMGVLTLGLILMYAGFDRLAATENVDIPAVVIETVYLAYSLVIVGGSIAIASMYVE